MIARCKVKTRMPSTAIPGFVSSSYLNFMVRSSLSLPHPNNPSLSAWEGPNLLSPLNVFTSGKLPVPIGDGDTLGDRVAATGCGVGFEVGCGFGCDVGGEVGGQGANAHPSVMSLVTVEPSGQILVPSRHTGQGKKSQSLVVTSRPLSVVPSAQSILSSGLILFGHIGEVGISVG